MHDPELKSETQRQWEAAAPGWARWESVIADGLIEVTDAILKVPRLRWLPRTPPSLRLAHADGESILGQSFQRTPQRHLAGLGPVNIQ